MGNETATDRFIEKTGDILDMLGCIRKAAEDHWGVDPRDVTWDHVGSLSHVAELLQNVIDFQRVARVTITAKYAGRCKSCGGLIAKGSQISWIRGVKGARHVECPNPELLAEPISPEPGHVVKRVVGFGITAASGGLCRHCGTWCYGDCDF